jgi:hypothetical protein
MTSGLLPGMYRTTGAAMTVSLLLYGNLVIFTVDKE